MTNFILTDWPHTRTEVDIGRWWVGIDSWDEGVGIQPTHITLSRREALELASHLPEIKALFQWAKDVREQVDEGHLFLLELVADKIFEPFEEKEKGNE